MQRMIETFACRRYLRGLAALEPGDLAGLLEQFDARCEFVFAGQTVLGAGLRSREALQCWFERLCRLLPYPRLEVREQVVSGWPWDVRLAARAVIHSTVAGAPYENDFAQFLRLRWGRVVSDLVLEDTQRFERAGVRLVSAGIAEAAADSIRDYT